MQNLFVIEGFYTAENFGLMSNFQRTCNMKGLHVPQNIYYPSRLEAFPTWVSELNRKSLRAKTKVGVFYLVFTLCLSGGIL